jgi:hypothetical protein
LLQWPGQTSCPQSTTPLHFVSVTKPQLAPSSLQVEGTQAPASGTFFVAGPQRFESVPPHTSVPVQVPHVTTPPQLMSVTKPQLAFSAAQLEGQLTAAPPSSRIKPPSSVAPASLAPVAASAVLPPTLASGACTVTLLPRPDFPQPDATAKAPSTTKSSEPSRDFMPNNP